MTETINHLMQASTYQDLIERRILLLKQLTEQVRRETLIPISVGSQELENEVRKQEQLATQLKALNTLIESTGGPLSQHHAPQHEMTSAAAGELLNSCHFWALFAFHERRLVAAVMNVLWRNSYGRSLLKTFYREEIGDVGSFGCPLNSGECLGRSANGSRDYLK